MRSSPRRKSSSRRSARFHEVAHRAISLIKRIKEKRSSNGPTHAAPGSPAQFQSSGRQESSRRRRVPALRPAHGEDHRPIRGGTRRLLAVRRLSNAVGCPRLSTRSRAAREPSSKLDGPPPLLGLGRELRLRLALPAARCSAGRRHQGSVLDA
jgi:hypothetical protein